MVTAVFLTRNLPYDPRKDFTPITAAVEPVTCLAVHPSLPVNSVKEFLDYARANPGKLTIGGSNPLTRITAEYLMRLSGTQMLWVTYQGAQQTSQALFNGDLDLSISASVPYASYIKEGRMLGLATTSPKREPRVPDMPTVREAGYAPLEGCGWLAIFAPAGTPRPVVDRLNGDTPSSPWPDWYPSGYVGLLNSVASWYELLTQPPDSV